MSLTTLKCTPVLPFPAWHNPGSQRLPGERKNQSTLQGPGSQAHSVPCASLLLPRGTFCSQGQRDLPPPLHLHVSHSGQRGRKDLPGKTTRMATANLTDCSASHVINSFKPHNRPTRQVLLSCSMRAGETEAHGKQLAGGDTGDTPPRGQRAKGTERPPRSSGKNFLTGRADPPNRRGLAGVSVTERALSEQHCMGRP